jgi:hypothetical protein
MTASFQILSNSLFIDNPIIPRYTAQDTESAFKYPSSLQVLTWGKQDRRLQDSTAMGANVPTTSETHRITLGSITAT